MVFIKNSMIWIVALFAATTNATIQNFKSCINNGDLALTFDDGPQLKNTEKVLDILKKENVKATFFVNGQNCIDVRNNQKAQELIKREFNEGHVIASHTYSHKVITDLNDEELTYEMATLNDLLYELIGVKPAFFRPPEGRYTEQNAVVLESLGFTANILWNLDSLDWKSTEDPIERYHEKLDKASPSTDSFIALNHDIQDRTALKNLAIIIPYIKKLGYRFVTIDECIGLNAYQDVNTAVNTPGAVSTEPAVGNTPGVANDPNAYGYGTGAVQTNNNAQTQVVDPQTQYVETQVQYVDAQGQYVDAQNVFIDAQGQYVDAQGQYVYPVVVNVDNSMVTGSETDRSLLTSNASTHSISTLLTTLSVFIVITLFNL